MLSTATFQRVCAFSDMLTQQWALTKRRGLSASGTFMLENGHSLLGLCSYHGLAITIILFQCQAASQSVVETPGIKSLAPT